ncbi:TIGR00725 family protein [Methanoculleus sp. Wushi-C6]|uniref:TIGR00725 family protein n=1 Tax=Methanoculleus caldifontis TaxID=2651577 RepID=A0ABU3X175_9EURY|nr:TIGR00725 family protein [Methanoculleus sp. Wushi-C6]MDV2481367.1 TIGR00725 family protein [Methanoculleus sp. Wushi-C6]
MQIAVIGRGDCSGEEYRTAETVGRLIAESNATVCCGGLGGVMEAACRGAKEAGGMTLGILPDVGEGNAYLDVVIRTGMGHARNVILVNSADAVIAVGGGYGTLSEVAVSLKIGKPVFGLSTWEIKGVRACAGPEEAVSLAVRAGRRSRPSRSPRDPGGSL